VQLLTDLRAEQYADAVQAAHEMLGDPTFIRLRDAIARALSAVPRLEAEDIETLARIHRQKEQPCNT
jgi:hypothetical protein